jgi:hypothetical protein
VRAENGVSGPIVVALTAVRAGIAAPLIECPQDRIAFRSVGPDGVVHVEADFIISFMHAIVLATKMWNVADPHNSIEWDMLVIDFDDW